MDDLCSKWQHLNVIEDEVEVVALEEDDLEEGKSAAEFILTGKLMTDKPYNLRALKKVIGNLWNVKKGLEVTEIQDSALKFSFGCAMEKKKVLDNEPWLFDKALLSLSDPVVDGVDGTKPPLCTKFWTQIHGLTHCDIG